MAGMTLAGSSLTLSSASTTAAMNVVAAQQAYTLAHANFVAAMAGLKAGVPDAKAVADTTMTELKVTKATLDAALLAQTAQVKDSTVSTTSSTCNANLFHPRTAFRNVSTITCLDDFPSPDATPCKSPLCHRTPRLLAACSCNIRDAYSILNSKDLAIARTQLLASRFADSPVEVQKAAKEIYATVNAMVNNSRGAPTSKGSGQSGEKQQRQRGFSRKQGGRSKVVK